MREFPGSETRRIRQTATVLLILNAVELSNSRAVPRLRA